MLDNDELLWLELERVRLPSPVLSRIEELAEERRRLLQALPDMLFEREQILRRLTEIDLELERLWDLRRRELLFVRQLLSPERPEEPTTLEEVEEQSDTSTPSDASSQSPTASSEAS